MKCLPQRAQNFSQRFPASTFSDTRTFSRLRVGGWEASDGCWVEPDGTCDHGKPS